MPAIWQISSFPTCQFHVFLSHSAEDREWLILPLFERLKRVPIIPWLDLHHYPLGTDTHEALRERILRCRHIVYLVTQATLAVARGWTVLERAYAGILQDNLCACGIDLCHVELPLFFLPRNEHRLTRSVWQSVRGKASFHVPSDGNPVDWAVAQIARFVHQEQNWGIEVSEMTRMDPTLRKTISADKRPGLHERLRAEFPILDPPCDAV